MKSFKEFTDRQKELMGIPQKEKYAIELTIHSDNYGLITEHNKYQKFKKTQNRYSYHPADENIPVQRHYHIFPNNSKKEIYAVNVDGTAHHKINRGYEVSKKEAAELRKLGVQIPKNNILEDKEILITENVNSYSSIFIIISE